MLNTAHNLARWKAQKRARSVFAGWHENGRVAGSQQARSRLTARNTAAPAGRSWCASPARQTFRRLQPEGSGTRPFSGCPEGSACGARGVMPPAPLAAAGAAKAAQQQREAVRFIAAHCRAEQAAAGESCRSEEAGRQGEALLAGLAQRQQERRSFQGYGTGVGVRRVRQATDRQGGGHVGGRSPGRNVSPTRSGRSQGNHDRSQGHIGGTGARAWGIRFAHLRLIGWAQGVSAFTPRAPCHPGAGARGASGALGQGPGRRMSLAARQSARSSRWGRCGGYVSSTATAGAASRAGVTASRGPGRCRGYISPTQAIKG